MPNDDTNQTDPERPEEPPVKDVAAERARKVKAGLKAAADALVTAGAWTSKKTQDFYAALDPALRQHVAESAAVGLTFVAGAATPSLNFNVGPGRDERRCTVFVHGLGGHRGNFVPIQRYFAHRGRHNSVSVGFSDKTSINAMAKDLGEVIAAIIEQNDLETRPIDLVAHSMGGIVCRTALVDHDVAPFVRRLTTIATPHHGTQLARFLNTNKIRDLRPDSLLMQRLSAQIPWHADADRDVPELVCFWSRRDLVMMPPECAIVEGAHVIERSDCSHNGFLIRPDTIRAIFAAVDDRVIDAATWARSLPSAD